MGKIDCLRVNSAALVLTLSFVLRGCLLMNSLTPIFGVIGRPWGGSMSQINVPAPVVAWCPSDLESETGDVFEMLPSSGGWRNSWRTRPDVVTVEPGIEKKQYDQRRERRSVIWKSSFNCRSQRRAGLSLGGFARMHPVHSDLHSPHPPKGRGPLQEGKRGLGYSSTRRREAVGSMSRERETRMVIRRVVGA